MAEELHGDAIVVDPHPRDAYPDRVVFEPFVGVGPLRYLELFEMPERKGAAGKVTPFTQKKAMPRLRDIEPPEMVPEVLPYILREVNAMLLLRQVEARGPRFK